MIVVHAWREATADDATTAVALISTVARSVTGDAAYDTIAFFRYKSIIGRSLRARSPGGRVTEAVIACHVLNQMTARGRPESYRLGR